MKLLPGRNKVILLLFLLLPMALFAQDVKISGVIINALDETPIPGVSVAVPGTSYGTITDFDGHYELIVPDGTDSLEFSFVGMETQRVAIADQKKIDIRMQEKLYTVNEVVITALGISKEAKSVGYSMTAVTGDELTEGNSRSVLNALQGKVAGVNISSASGAPGASTRILMRGVSSLTGSNQPLFIIDGVPVSNSQSGSSSINGGTDFGNKVNDLNPDDIQSISLLKGASGTALYGSQAANGVIIITTKSGQRNKKSEVSLNSSLLLEQPLRLVDYQNTYGQGINGDAVLYENMSWGPEFDYRFRPWGHEVDNTIRVKAYQPLPDNVKEFFETGKSLSNSLSMSGGSEQTTYYFSYSNITWDGIFPTDADTYAKHSFSLRSSHQLAKWLKASGSVNYLRKQSSYVPTGQGEQSVYNQVMQTPRDISLVELANLDSVYNSVDNHYSLYTVNPYYILKNNGNKNKEDRLYGSFSIEMDLLKDLKLLWRVGTDVSNEQRKVWRSRVEPEGNNEYSSVYEPGSVAESSIYQMQINSDVLLTYTRDFENWSLSLMAGQNLNQKEGRGLAASVSSLGIPGFFNLSNSTEQPSASESTVLRRMAAVYGSADISFKGMLFMAFSIRNEWSSTLPPENNSYFFPGVNAGFIFSELMPSFNDVLSFGKIRASWARVGNDAAPYLVQSVFSQGGHSDGFGYFSYPLINGVNSYDVGNLLANEDLKPEITDEYEVGTDLRFFKNRFSIDFVYYNKSTTNLIWPAPVTYASGYARQMQNLGKITNYGFEAVLNLVPVSRKDFRWELGINFTRDYNVLDYLNSELEDAELNALRVDGGQQIVWLAIPGEPIGIFKGRGPEYTEDGKMVVDNQGLPVAAEELVTYGTSHADFFGGISSRFVLKDFSLFLQLGYSKGGLMYSRTKDITMWAGTVPVTLYNDRQPFIIPNSVMEVGEDENGDPVYVENTNPVDIVDLVSYWGNGGMEIDGASLLDKSYIKLREVVLNYSVPEKLTDKWPLERLDLSLIGKNLLLFTPAGQSYIDPELTTFGNDLAADFGEYGAQPSTRSVSLNLRIVF
ncbi:MAG: SusC/RagA family TonB-linked outer membrane protein [Bacteroidales bacterium]|nr:SusC/RagA family TonB-linked outer membrane protein [Bacteroidales bacterium]